MPNYLLPQNQTELEAAIANATEFTVSPDIIATLWDAQTCPVNLLPWLAWALSVDDWDAVWDEETQRRVIAGSIDIHRKKGTVGAIKKALTSLGHTGRLIEWWQTEPRGTPHTFVAEVEVGNRGLDDTTVMAIERQITAVKPVRSHFTLNLVGRSEALMTMAWASLSGEIAAVQPFQITQANAPVLSYHIGIGLHACDYASIQPFQIVLADAPMLNYRVGIGLHAYDYASIYPLQ